MPGSTQPSRPPSNVFLQVISNPLHASCKPHRQKPRTAVFLLFPSRFFLYPQLQYGSIARGSPSEELPSSWQYSPQGNTIGRHVARYVFFAFTDCPNQPFIDHHKFTSAIVILQAALSPFRPSAPFPLFTGGSNKLPLIRPIA